MEQIESTPVKTTNKSKDLRDISAWESPLPDPQRAERLAAKLRELGINLEEITE